MIRFDHLKEEFLSCLEFGKTFEELTYGLEVVLSEYLLHDGYLCRGSRLCIPRTLVGLLGLRDVCKWICRSFLVENLWRTISTKL